jgi:hypothetical protein
MRRARRIGRFVAQRSLRDALLNITATSLRDFASERAGAAMIASKRL